MNNDHIKEIRNLLRSVGAASLAGPDGKTLYLVLNRNLGIEERGVLIALDGAGAMFFKLDRPLNPFRLVQNGFSLRIAPALAELVNAIMSLDESAMPAITDHSTLS